MCSIRVIYNSVTIYINKSNITRNCTILSCVIVNLILSLENTVNKFLERDKRGGNEAFKLFCVCTFLDPRFKDLHCLSPAEKAATYKYTRDAILAIALRLRCPKIAEKHKADKTAAEAKAAREAAAAAEMLAAEKAAVDLTGLTR